MEGSIRKEQADGAGRIAAPAPRVEDHRLITGAGTFVDDLEPEGCLHLEFFRSPEKPGRIAAFDIDAARAMPGVVAVLTGADVANCGAAPVNPLVALENPPPFELLAGDILRAPGQAVAAVIATSRLAAVDAAEAITCRINRQAGEAGVGTEKAGLGVEWGEATPSLFDGAAHVVSVEIRHPLLAPAALEPRACLAEPRDDGLVVHAATQTPHRLRDDLATVLGVIPAKIRVIAPDVGGAFGGKASVTPEEALVAFAALRLGRPVKWRASRSEEFLSATRGRGAMARGRLALDARGRFLALDAEFAFPLGHWWPYSAAAPTNNAARILPGPYRIPAVHVRARAEAAAAPAVNIYRGAGRPEAAMLLERLVDEAAAKLGFDAARLRRLNFRRATTPGRTVAGLRLDSADHGRLLRIAGARSDLAGLKRDRAKARRRGGIFGIGIASYVEPCGQGWESGTVGLDAEGRIVGATGTSAQGQGRETAFAAIVGEALGLPAEVITIRHGDTARTPAGIGALASRSTAIGGSAIRKAALMFRNRALKEAGEKLGLPLEGLVLDRDGIAATGSFHRISWRELAAGDISVLADGLHLAARTRFSVKHEAWASGAVIAAVSLDRETGELRVERLVWADDAGNIINPTLAEGQLIGGMAQGFGEAMMEQFAFSPAGELITGSFQDYAIPRAADVPPVEIVKAGIPSKANPLGVKGVGEAGCIGVPAALVNAAVDALRPFGVMHLDMPLTSEKLWRLIRGAKGTITP